MSIEMSPDEVGRPVPASEPLELACLGTPEDIAAAARTLLWREIHVDAEPPDEGSVQHAIVYMAPGWVGCKRAEEFLSRHGFEVSTRSITNHAHADEVRELGFEVVPVVVVDGRAFAGFPDEVLMRELGLPAPDSDPEAGRALIRDSLRLLESVAELATHVPNDMWGIRLVPDRDRPLGQWVWHIFEFPLAMTDIVDTGMTNVAGLHQLSELSQWDRRDDFRTFERIATYGRETVARLRRWVETVSDERLARVIDSPWGPLPGSALLRHVHRHTSIHLRQLVDFLRDRLPDAEHLPSEEFLASVPSYASLRDD